MESVGEKEMLAGFLHAIGVVLNLHVKGHGNFIDLIIFEEPVMAVSIQGKTEKAVC